MSTLHQRNWMFIFALGMFLVAVVGGGWSTVVVVAAAGEMKGRVNLTMADHERRLTKSETHSDAVDVTLNAIDKSTALLTERLTNLYVLTIKKPSIPASK